MILRFDLRLGFLALEIWWDYPLDEGWDWDFRFVPRGEKYVFSPSTASRSPFASSRPASRGTSTSTSNRSQSPSRFARSAPPTSSQTTMTRPKPLTGAQWAMGPYCS